MQVDDQQQVLAVSNSDPPPQSIDLGNVALLPGLVNAHTHLEFSDCEQPIGTPGMELASWIGHVVSQRGAATQKQKLDAIELGLRESMNSGTCLIGEICTPPLQYPTGNQQPQVYCFAEVLGLSKERYQERMDASYQQFETRPTSTGWSPHAPYSTNPQAVQWCIDRAIQHNQAIAMHVAESPAERELIADGSGPFRVALESLGAWRPDLFPRGDNSIESLIQQLAQAPRALLVHGNDLQGTEIDLIAEHQNLTVVFCPRTHAFFGHDRHPIDRLLHQGIRVALGTDSRASNPDLNLWREVQHVLNHRPDIAPSCALAMATLNGADAIGVQSLGKIRPGTNAIFGMVRTEASTLDQVYADLACNDYVPVAGTRTD